MKYMLDVFAMMLRPVDCSPDPPIRAAVSKTFLGPSRSGRKELNKYTPFTILAELLSHISR